MKRTYTFAIAVKCLFFYVDGGTIRKKCVSLHPDMSKHNFAISIIMTLFCVAGVHAQPYWDNPGVYRLNKVQPHDRVVPDGQWTLSLNGEWAFRLFDTPQKATLTPAQWDKTAVPGCINRGGNTLQPSRDNNPTCVYMRRFMLPASWQGRRTIAKFGAVASAMYLYVNGQEVGYSQDSRTPAEWDITRYLVEGRNTMAVKVVSWSDGSTLECQDMQRMGGIARDVMLYSVPWTYISDVKVIADVDTGDWSTGRLDVMVDLNREVRGGSVEWKVEGDECLAKGRKVLEARDWYTSFSATVARVQPWCDTTPVLYTLRVSLLDADGNTTESIVKRLGFRHVDISDGQLRVNGRPVVIRGVNRVEHSRAEGGYVTPDAMRQEVAQLKTLGINAVRTRHYPADELWYDLCDSAGIYVWDDANLDGGTHGHGEGSLALAREWLNPILDRIYNMYKRDRNHPCVIAWSLGGECGNGYCLEEAYRLLKGKDNTRPVVYSRAGQAWNTDIVFPAYPSTDDLAAYARDGRNRHPLVMAEYCYAMGHDTRLFADYWDTIGRYPLLQGGFLWDWIGQKQDNNDKQ